MVDIIMPGLRQGKFILVAEIGVNYYDVAEKLNISLMEAAKFMVMAAHNAGIHSVKFQSYKAGSLAAKFSPAYWDRSEEPTASQYELFCKFDKFGEKEYKELAEFCNQVGIEFLSTPFDTQAVDYLEPLMNVYKISSSDLSNLPFIEYIAHKGKPIMLSTGASELKEIREAVKCIRQHNDCELTLLHCVLEYPTPYEHANLAKISALQEEFSDVYIGYSDHTKPDASLDVVKTAYILGAQVIEKHFTVDKLLKGNDHYHAMDGHDAEKILRGIAFLDSLKGDGTLRSLPSEASARKNARRSLVATVTLAKGEVLTREKLTFKRPGTGISPAEVGKVLGKKAKRVISQDEIISWDMLE